MQRLPDNSKGFAAQFDAGPIPGQSLTRAPGSYPFEQPPRFVDPEEALQALVNQLSEEKTALRLLNMLDLGVPVYSIVYTILLTGFTEGKWTPDVALLLAEPLATLLIRVAQDAGIKVELGVQEEEDNLMELVAKKYEAENLVEEEDNYELPESGLMEPM